MGRSQIELIKSFQPSFAAGLLAGFARRGYARPGRNSVIGGHRAEQLRRYPPAEPAVPSGAAGFAFGDYDCLP